jgi:putative effector of murein hydrolase
MVLAIHTQVGTGKLVAQHHQTLGSITSTVSANTTSGFSIVSYTGTGTNVGTVGHGLGVAPAMILLKIEIVVEDHIGEFIINLWEMVKTFFKSY